MADATDLPTVWVFEDQLNPKLTSLVEAPKGSPVFMVESHTHQSAWPFHKVRLAFLMSAMRHFAKELEDAGRTVAYYPLKSRGYRDSFSALAHHFKKRKNRELWITEPSEWHCRHWLETVPERLEREFETPGVTLKFFPNRMFLTDRQHFAKWLEGRKRVVMEHYYRQMRRDHDLLMDGDNPAGGEWNFDRMNRKTPPKDHEFPEVSDSPPDEITKSVIKEIERRYGHHPGDLGDFAMAVTRKDAKKHFREFVKKRLPLFGDYEDAMVTGEKVLYHSMISPLINAGLLEPLEVCDQVEKAYEKGDIPINSAEGFVRQIIGWREFVYGIYGSFMPEYRSRNPRGDDRPLPEFFWTGDTDLNCLKQSLGQVVGDGFSHHIQRLMVICNFATLAGLEPQQVNDWFYAMYVDSHDWVVTPNVIGMAMNSDEGVIATKPYVSSANYIDKMSDYCGDCRYNPKDRTGEDACPFNFMYWAFNHDHREELSKNPRVKALLKNLNKFGKDEVDEILALRDSFLDDHVPLTVKGDYGNWNVPRGRAEAEGKTIRGEA